MSKTAPTPPNGAEAQPGPPTQYPFFLPPVEPGEIGRIGHYRVLHLLGSGGMGMVFAAEDLALRRHVAIKVMHPEMAADSNGGWQRFLREARALGGVKHQNLVTVYQAFQDRGTVFLVMELLHGESLEAWIRRTATPNLADVLLIAREIAAGLAALHGHGLIHRDIKPANIWLERKPDTGRRKAEAAFQVKILDLGLVRSVEEEDGLTASGMVMGTPAYMSLEQVRGLPLDHRTDLFSLGCVMYAVCTGRAPFQADNPVAQATALIRGNPQPVCELNRAIPVSLSDLITKLLAKEPYDRPTSANEVIEQLGEVTQPSVAVVAKPNPTPKTEPLRKPERTQALELVPETEPLRVPTQKTQAAVVSEFEETEDTERMSRRTKAKPKRKRKSFMQRHGWTLFALLWLVVACLVVIAVIGRDDKPTLKPQPDTTTSPPKALGKGVEVVFLSDFPTARTVSGIPLPAPPGFDGKIRVGGRVWEHGIFMHPAPRELPPPARITFKLGKEFVKFSAEVAFNDSAPPAAPPATFLVYFDGKQRWTSNPIQRDMPPQSVELDVRGVTDLTLEVVPEGSERGAHAVWLDPRVTR